MHTPMTVMPCSFDSIDNVVKRTVLEQKTKCVLLCYHYMELICLEISRSVEHEFSIVRSAWMSEIWKGCMECNVASNQSCTTIWGIYVIKNWQVHWMVGGCR